MSLDDLVALNDEILGLVRTGVPLEQGLAGWGRDLPAQLRRVTARLGAATAAGKGLAEALSEDQAQIPRVYAAVVEAGLRAGRLPAALESVAHSMRTMREVRSAVAMAVLYPLVLVLLSYGLFITLAVAFVPSLIGTYETHLPRYLSWLAAVLGRLWTPLVVPGLGLAIPLALIPPVVLVVVAIVWWRRSARAMVVDARAASRWLGWLPVAPRVARHSRSAALAEIFGLLVEQDVPIQDAIVLATECTGDGPMVERARQVAHSIRAGAPPEQYRQLLDDFPPLLAWLSISQARQTTLVALARHCADTYRRRIARETQWLRDFLPIWLIAVVGGVVVFAYALSIFLPFTELLEKLQNVSPSLRIRP